MNIIRNYLYTLLYQLINIILPFITIPYISRVLGADNLGINAYTTSIITYFILIANFGISVYGNRAISYARDSQYECSKTFWEILIVKIIMGSISLSLFFIFVYFYGEFSEFLYIQSIHIIAMAIDISWFFIGVEDFKKSVFRNIIVKLISFLLILAFIDEANDLWLYMLILSGSAFIGNISLWSYLRKIIQPITQIELDYIKHFKPMLYIFIPQLVSVVFISLNKLFLGGLSTFTQAGFFDNADKLIRIILTLITSLGTVIFPRISNSFKHNNLKAVNELTRLIFLVSGVFSFPIVVGFFFISDTFSLLFFGSDFYGISSVISILAVGLIFMGWSSVIGNQYLISINQPKGLTVSLLIAMLIIIPISFCLVPIYGANGAAISAVVGELIILLVQMVYINKHIRITYLLSDMYKIIFSTFIMGVGCFLIENIIIDPIVEMIMQVAVGALIYVLCLSLVRISEIDDIKRKLLVKFSLNRRGDE